MGGAVALDKFKLKAGVQPWHDIDENVFAEQTGKVEPYVRKGWGGADRYYAVCPVCDNPIQIIGLFKEQDETAGRGPYGKHHDADDMPYAVYDRDEYEACPYRRVNKKSRKLKRSPKSEKGRQLYDFMRRNFDLVVEAWNSYTGVAMSKSFAEMLLRSWRVNEGWLYYDSTVNNLPMKLLQAEPAYKLYGRRVIEGSDLLRALRSIRQVGLEDAGNGSFVVRSADGGFLDLMFMVYGHTRKAVGDHLDERFKFKVTLGGRQVLYEQIAIEHGKLLEAALAADPDRSNSWLDIAAKVL